MAEDISYDDGDIVWVKMNKLWWPGEVHGSQRLPSDFFDQFKKQPLVVVKFFQEDNYHCINQLNQVARFNCEKKNEFIKKGLDLYYAKHSYMTDFPGDVAIAEKRTGGDPSIIYSKEFMPVVKPDKSTPTSVSKGSTSRSRRGQQVQTNTPAIPRVMIKPDHDTRILVSSNTLATASTSSLSSPITPTAADQKYNCTSCSFSTNRINTFVWHQKTHSSQKTPQATTTTPKFRNIKQTPTASQLSFDETKSSDPDKLQPENENVLEIVEQSKVTEPEVKPTKSTGKTPKRTATSGKPKSKAKRARHSNKSKEMEEAPKTDNDNKLKNILDDWSDDETGEISSFELAGPSSNKKTVSLDGEEDTQLECSSKKKLKFDDDSSENANEAVVAVNEDSIPMISSSIPSVTDQSKTDSKNEKDENITRQPQSNDEVKPQTRFSLRSGRTALTNDISPITPKRKGRAKRNANDSLSVAVEIKECEAEPIVPKGQVIETESEKISVETITPLSTQAKEVNKRNSKTSRKGKPRRKEEIKLANNVSVAVLVEKTNPTTIDKESDEKLDVSAENDKYASVVHKKIRYMSRNSTEDQRKSVDSKLPELINDSDNHIDEIVKLDNHKENETTTANDEDATEVSEKMEPCTTNDSNSDDKKSTNENSTAGTESVEEQRVAQKCYERKAQKPKENLSVDQSDDTSVDLYDTPSSSNLRRKSPKRYENTRNRRKSDRKMTSDEDDYTSIMKANDETIESSVELNKSPDEYNPKLLDALNGSGKDSTNISDQSNENSNSKTSTPEKADTSKELDCFDFTEDECLQPPEVLNRRKRLPPAKVFELDDIDKIEEQRKLDEEAARLAQQREEEHQKLHAELENLLNSTTPVAIPEIPIGARVQENFPERRAEKDPEKVATNQTDTKDPMLPPKERNKRIFKSRNRNRRPESDVGDSKTNNLLQTTVRSEENLIVARVEMEQKIQSNDLVTETDANKDSTAHDLKIEIAETLINLSPQTDLNDQPIREVVSKPTNKRKETVRSTKTAKNAKKSRSKASVKNVESIPDVCREQTTITNELFDSSTKTQSTVLHVQPADNLPSNPDNISNFESTPQESREIIKKTNETETISPTLDDTASNSTRDFSRIRLIEKIDNHSPIHTIDEAIPSKIHQLPLKKAVVLTQTECNTIITRIPKKRKSQMDDDVPAFVIERPKDQPDAASSSTSDHIKKEPKSFVVTKTIKKQMTVEPSTPNTLSAAGSTNFNSSETIDGIDIQHERKANAHVNIVPLVNQVSNSLATQITETHQISSIESPVIVTSHLSANKTSPVTTMAQNQTAIANVLGSLSANRPCTIAPAKKSSYRRPADMTGSTQKQIGIDGKGNPIIAYQPINPVVTQATIPSTSQFVQSFSPSVQSNSGNQFVITSKGALITHKPFITTTHSTQSTLTKRPSIHVHTQIIRSPNPQAFQTPQQLQQHHHQQQHLQQHFLSSPQSNQIIIQTANKAANLQISSVAPHGTLQASNDGLVIEEQRKTVKKRTVRRVPKNQQVSTQQMRPNQQQVILNSEINHISNAPVPPLIPFNDQSMPLRKPITKQQSTQMTLIQEPQIQSKATHVEVTEQLQDNVQEILALPGDTPGFGGPPGSYFLCKLNEMGVYTPIDSQPLYLDVTDNTNLLKPNAPDATVQQVQSVTMNETGIVQQSPALVGNERVVATHETVVSDQDANNPKYLINISDGQQLLVDQQSLMALANGEEFPQFVTPDGHQIILQSGQHDILSAIAFAEDVGLIAGQQILIPEDDLAVIQSQGGNHDILAAALAGTEAFSQEQFIDNVLIQSTNGVENIEDIADPMVYHTIPQPAALTNAVTNETNAVLTQPPIMSTLEHPTKTDRISPNNSLELCGQNLDESLAVIGVTSSNTNVPTSLELPITITNPAIAPKTTSSMATIYPPAVTTEHDLDYDIFSSPLPITHHLTQPLAANENYRTVNVMNSVEGNELVSNVVNATSNDQ